MHNFGFFEMIWNAGPMVKFVMLLLLAFSVGSWTIIFLKHKLFKEIGEDSEYFLDTFWKCKNLSEAFQVAQECLSSPEASIFITGYNELQKLNRNRNTGVESLEMQLATMDNLKRSLHKAEGAELVRFSKSLSFLATTGSATPFIGLFGTVWGIMTAFQDIGQRGSASLAIVAPGISEALIATAAGLGVAIPAVIFYNHYANKLADLENDMQSFSADFLNLVERDMLSRASKSSQS